MGFEFDCCCSCGSDGDGGGGGYEQLAQSAPQVLFELVCARDINAIRTLIEITEQVMSSSNVYTRFRFD